MGVFQLTVILSSPSSKRVGGAERDIGAGEREEGRGRGDHTRLVGHVISTHH